MTQSPAIFFHPDAIESDGKDLVGRRAAGQSFLRGFLQHVPGPQINAVTQDKAAAVVFNDVARALGETREIKVSQLRGNSDLTQAGTIFFPGPGYLNAAWRRQRFGPAKCSLVGITLTMSTRRVIEGLHKLMLEPVEPWDAIICTSRAVHSVVSRQLALEAEFITQRFGARRVPQPMLPIIPLGIHTQDFSHRADQRRKLRAKFTAEDAVVVMSMGRHTSVEKANPAPLFIALEQVAQAARKPVHLWMVGWANRAEETALHLEGAKSLAPSVKVTLVDGRADDVRRHIWSAADIFTLPVDNIQETFGLVPVEAMAAGLPVVMPDWNGFRDTIVDGETGILVPTRMPDPGPTGRRIAARYADGSDSYLRYLSLIQHQTQIDIPAYVEALLALVNDAELRKRMGAAGRAHARAKFDWQAVIPQYLALAQELAEMRAGSASTSPRLRSGPMNPLEVDPFDLYQHYPTGQLEDGDLVSLRRPLDAAGLAAIDRVNGRDLYRRKAVPDDAVLALAAEIAAAGPMTIAQLAKASPLPRDHQIAGMLFLAKYDFVAITPASQISAINRG